MNDDAMKILWRKAQGYDATETIEEYAVQNDTEVLSKKKVTIKHIPPDTAALKAYLELTAGKDISLMTDEELAKEEERLLGMLKRE